MAKIKAVETIQPYLSQLELVLIPDITVPGAFDAVADGLWAMIHVASPTFSGFGEVNVSEFCSTSWRVTQSVLHFAANTPSVKRVVITSSISAIIPRFFDTAPHDSQGFYTSQIHHSIFQFEELQLTIPLQINPQSPSTESSHGLRRHLKTKHMFCRRSSSRIASANISSQPNPNYTSPLSASFQGPLLGQMS